MSIVPKKWVENDEWQTSSISDVTVHVFDDGTDDATNRYLNCDAEATSWQLRTDQVITISSINGQTLKMPLTINANKDWIVSRKAGLRLRNVVINVLTANTNLKLFVLETARGGI